MTDSRIEGIPFDKGAVKIWVEGDALRGNWPVVYTINNGDLI